MALPAIYLKLTMVIRSPQKIQFFNVFYYKLAGAPPMMDDPQALVLSEGSEIFDHLTTSIAAVMTKDTGPFLALAQLHDGGQIYEATVGSDSFEGELEVDEEPDYAAVVIQKRTAVAGRSGRGRWFVAPVPESLTDENELTDAGNTLYTTLANSWKDLVTTTSTTWIPCLYSKKLATLETISGVRVVKKLGTQLQRKSKALV